MSDLGDGTGSNLRRYGVSVAMLLVAIAMLLMAVFSLRDDVLYTPWGSYGAGELKATFYYAISIYITIGATLLTSAVIRIALRMTK